MWTLQTVAALRERHWHLEDGIINYLMKKKIKSIRSLIRTDLTEQVNLGQKLDLNDMMRILASSEHISNLGKI